MAFIRKVIRETTRPSWLNTVPEQFGDSRTGTLKADEWRSFATIYLPIALILLWSQSTNESTNRFTEILDNTMSLVQVITLACYRVTSEYRAKAIGLHLKDYLSGIHRLFPEVDGSTNQHMSLHLPVFIRLFGPVHSWWTYPFERLIGVLQHLPTNHKFGQYLATHTKNVLELTWSLGELESTLVQSFMRAAALRCWISRNNQDEVVQVVSSLLAKAFPPGRGPQHENSLFASNIYEDDMDTDETYMMDSKTSGRVKALIAHVAGQRPVLSISGPITFRKRILINGVMFSTSNTHLGNSTIDYSASHRGALSSGTIEHIVQIDNSNNDKRAERTTYFAIRPFSPLPEGSFDDPFAKYPDFPARVHSIHPENTEIILPSQVRSHSASFAIPNTNRVVTVSLSRY